MSPSAGRGSGTSRLPATRPESARVAGARRSHRLIAWRTCSRSVRSRTGCTWTTCATRSTCPARAARRARTVAAAIRPTLKLYSRGRTTPARRTVVASAYAGTSSRRATATRTVSSTVCNGGAAGLAHGTRSAPVILLVVHARWRSRAWLLCSRTLALSGAGAGTSRRPDL